MDSLGTTHIGGEVVVIPTKAGWPSLIFHKEIDILYINYQCQAE